MENRDRTETLIRSVVKQIVKFRERLTYLRFYTIVRRLALVLFPCLISLYEKKKRDVDNKYFLVTNFEMDKTCFFLELSLL